MNPLKCFCAAKPSWTQRRAELLQWEEEAGFWPANTAGTERSGGRKWDELTGVLETTDVSSASVCCCCCWSHSSYICSQSEVTRSLLSSPCSSFSSCCFFKLQLSSWTLLLSPQTAEISQTTLWWAGSTGQSSAAEINVDPLPLLTSRTSFTSWKSCSLFKKKFTPMSFL